MSGEQEEDPWINVHESINGMGHGLEALCENVGNSLNIEVDPRMLALARTHFQQGLMCLRRSVDEGGGKW